MTKIKQKSVFVILTLFVALVCAVLTFSFTSNGAVAYAATTPRYTMTFNYTHYYKYNTSTSIDGSGTNVTTTGALKSTQYGTASISFYIYGSGYSGTGILANGDTINSSAINIEMSSGYAYNSITVTNSSGTEVGKVANGKSLGLSSLSDGTYNVTVSAYSLGWNPNPRAYAAYSITCTFSFVVDTTAPTISGASTSTTGKYTNSAFTVYASDNRSVENLYMMAPNVSYYSSVGTSKKVTAGSANGLYRFYARDKAGNQSSTYYVYYDNTLPTGTIKNASGTTLTSSYVNTSFYYTATDIGGISYLQYKTPSSSSWTTYTSGSTISSSATNGTYTFRAIDKAGNYSSEKKITLDTAKPTGTIYGGTSVISNGGMTNASYIKFVGADSLSGVSAMYVKAPNSSSYASYSSGTQYSVDGVYRFYCVDNAGNASATYVVTLDKTAPSLICSQTGFYSTYQYGFTVSTSDTVGTAKLYYKTPTATAYSLANGTSYSVTDAMTNGKYYFYAVDEAGNQSVAAWINLNIVYPEAQKINSPTDNSVCYTWTDTGTTAKLNGSSYVSGSWIKAEGSYTLILTNEYGRSTTYTFSVGHYYVLEETVAATCTAQGYKLYVCSHCNDSYKSDYVAATGHKYEKTTTAPTCLEQGYTVYKCATCSNTYTSDYKSALGHNYVETAVEPTCTEEGYIKHACSRCEESFATDNIPALGHKYVETAVIATCTENGCLRHTCAVCGYEYQTNVVQASGHSYSTEVTLTATCTEKGERCHVCEKCGDSYTNEIPAIGHNYEITDAVSENGVTHRTYTCTTCGDTYTQDLGDQYEHVSSYVEHLFDLYAPYMWWVLLGTTSVWSAAIGIAIILAKKNDDKEKARKMLVNYVIGLVIIAAIVVACPYLIKGIAALVT